MHVLSRLRLRTKLTILMGLSALALVASIGVSASIVRQRMFDDRVDKLRAVVQTTLGLAQSLEDQVAVHQLTREQALEQLRKAAHVMRFDAGEGYIYAQTLDNTFVIHGADPKLENTTSKVKDASGKSLTSLIIEALGTGDHGVVSYDFVRPGQTQLQPKVAYVARFAPWSLVFAAGAYTGDLSAAFRAILLDLTTIGGIIIVVCLAVAWLINRDIVGSLQRLMAAMAHLANSISRQRFQAPSGVTRLARWPARFSCSRNTW